MKSFGVIMKRLILITLIVLIGVLTASETEDFKFCLGLYSDNHFQLAELELENFIMRYHESIYVPDARYLLANIFLLDEEYDKSKQIFQDLLIKNQQSSVRAEILLGLGQACYYLGDLSRAENQFNKFIGEYSRHDDLWKAYYYLGRIAFRNGNFGDSEKNYTQAQKRVSEPIITVGQLELAISINNRKQIENSFSKLLDYNMMNDIVAQAVVMYQNFLLSEETYQQVFDLDLDYIPNDSRYYHDYVLNYAIAYYGSQKYEQALSILKDVDNERAQYYKALCYLETDKQGKAEKILQELFKESTNDEISINSYFYLARLEKDTVKALLKFQGFINDNPNHDFLGAAYYQKALLEFKLGEFNEAANSFNYALDNNLDRDSQEKARYMIAETHFMEDQLETAKTNYQNYLNLYKKGKFNDEVIFKLGLIQYRELNFEKANEYFQELLDSYPRSDKVGMSNYYLGEMNLEIENYNKAKENYVLALTSDTDRAFIWMRIGQIYYITEKYDKALNAVNKIPDEETYLYRKHLLKGDVLFALNKYNDALISYSTAVNSSFTAEEKNKALSNKAWTFYQLKRFSEATELYESLAEENIKTDYYLMQAANSAFSSEKYNHAIELYNRYLDNFSQGSHRIKAQIGIADSYYNLNFFLNAAKQYMRLFTLEIPENILHNTLSSFEWACEQTTEIDFLEKIDSIVPEIKLDKHKEIILSKKADHELRKGLWENAIETIEILISSSEDIERIRDYRMDKTRALIKLSRYTEAEVLLENLNAEKKEAEVFLIWSDLYRDQNDSLEVINKLRQAALLTRKRDIWLELLELESQTGYQYFQDDMYKFREFAEGQDQDKAYIYQIKWKLTLNDTTSVGKLIKNLQGSKYKTIKAELQLLKGLIKYRQEKYNEAIPELLRVRYLFPEIIDIRTESEYLACLAYYKSGNTEEAMKLYQDIKNDLNENQKTEIESMILE